MIDIHDDWLRGMGRDLEHAQRQLAWATQRIDAALALIPDYGQPCQRGHCHRDAPVGYSVCWPCQEYLDGHRDFDPAMSPLRALWYQLKNRITR